MKTLLTLTMLAMTLLPALPAAGQLPRVRFDVPQTAAVRDITTREFAAAYPHDRLIEVLVPISMLVEQGDVQQVGELVHRLEIGAAAAQVVDFSPKTTLMTTVVGATRVERQSTQDAKVSLDVAATYAGLATGKLNSHYATQAREQAAYDQLPSLDVLTASGTIDRGRGVYFKLKASPRTTLEGAYDYVLVLRVPCAWRAGLLYVTSQASGDVRHFLPGTSQATTLGQGRFVVSLYQEGDAGAQQAARRYAVAETTLKRAAAAHRETILRRVYPTPLHKLGVTRDDALERDWLEAALYRGYASETTLQRLPSEVREAVEGLLAARRELL
jgi:hypothetical protein